MINWNIGKKPVALALGAVIALSGGMAVYSKDIAAQARIDLNHVYQVESRRKKAGHSSRVACLLCV